MQGVARLQGEGPSGPSPFLFPCLAGTRRPSDPPFLQLIVGARPFGVHLRALRRRRGPPSQAARLPGGAGPGEGDGAALLPIGFFGGSGVLRCGARPTGPVGLSWRASLSACWQEPSFFRRSFGSSYIFV